MRFTGAVVLLAVGLAAAGCAGSRLTHATRPAPAAPAQGVPAADCGDSSRLAPAPLPLETGVYTAGPATLAVGEDLAQLFRRPVARPFGSEAIALITGRRPVTLRVLPSPGVRLALEFTPPSGPGHAGAVLSDGRRAVRFPACSRAANRFRGGIVAAGRGCARVAVQPDGSPPATMLIPIADSLRGCPAPQRRSRLGYSWAPFLGVACGKPNSMACDRIGIGVNASRPAVLVVVGVAGRVVTLSPPSSGSNLWQGYLQDAGPEHGPLRVRPVSGTRLWFGSPELYPHARVTAFLVGGQVASTGDMTVLLHPGFG
ncbi:MAG: hypothetical protein ACR2GZ_05105 [Solirubrobacteraceae bacterium]